MASQTVCDHCRQVVSGPAVYRLLLEPLDKARPSLDFCRLECVSAWIADEPKRQARRDEMARMLVERGPNAIIPWNQDPH